MQIKIIQAGEPIQSMLDERNNLILDTGGLPVEITKGFVGPTLITENGEKLGIYFLDKGFELNYIAGGVDMTLMFVNGVIDVLSANHIHTEQETEVMAKLKSYLYYVPKGKVRRKVLLETWLAENGKYYYHWKASNGEITSTGGQGYATEHSAIRGAQRTKLDAYPAVTVRRIK